MVVWFQGEHLLLLLPESDIISEEFLIYVSEFLVSSSISHLFSEEEQTLIINAVRTEVTQAGLAYTRDVAWDFFLKWEKFSFQNGVGTGGGREGKGKLGGREGKGKLGR